MANNETENATTQWNIQKVPKSLDKDVRIKLMDINETSEKKVNLYDFVIEAVKDKLKKED